MDSETSATVLTMLLVLLVDSGLADLHPLTRLAALARVRARVDSLHRAASLRRAGEPPR